MAASKNIKELQKNVKVREIERREGREGQQPGGRLQPKLSELIKGVRKRCVSTL